MSSIRTFCVRWLAVIAIVSGALAPVSQTVAKDQAPCPKTDQEAVAKR